MRDRMAKLAAVTRGAKARVFRRATSAGATVRHLHDIIVAQKLEQLRYIIKLVARALELTSPEGAAALEMVLQVCDVDYTVGFVILSTLLLLTCVSIVFMQAHFALFATYMRPDVRPPTMSRTIAVGSMMSQKLDEPYDRSKSKVAADSCALQTTDRETSAPESMPSDASTAIAPSTADVGSIIASSERESVPAPVDPLWHLSAGIFYHTEAVVSRAASSSIPFESSTFRLPDAVISGTAFVRGDARTILLPHGTSFQNGDPAVDKGKAIDMRSTSAHSRNTIAPWKKVL